VWSRPAHSSRASRMAGTADGSDAKTHGPLRLESHRTRTTHQYPAYDPRRMHDSDHWLPSPGQRWTPVASRRMVSTSCREGLVRFSLDAPAPAQLLGRQSRIRDHDRDRTARLCRAG
jgi:hypothetical protein